MSRPARTALAAAAVAVAAFLLYHSTLLPGLDFGDTPSFQVMGGDSAITPRDAYPLYFAVAAPFVWAGGDRAHAMNLASAVEGAAAAALLVLVAVELTGQVLPAAAASLAFAGSYTFWSQSIITEVYALHACCVLASLLLLLRWDRRPTMLRLGAFFAAYAIGFGNHLSMILLLPGYTVFLLTAAPGSWRSMLTPRIVALAIGLAVLGALQYLWNIHALWLAPVPPSSLAQALHTFWFDVTKADWRQSMIAQVPRGMAVERIRMYAFDVRQQFSLIGVPLAALGLSALASRAPRRALLIALLFGCNVLFALTYDVGDSHVFFLPSHLMLALLFAPALAWLDEVPWPRDRSAAVPMFAAIGVVAAGVMIYDNYPALDRSGDTRPSDLLQALTAGIDDQHAVLLTDLNWQEQNGFNYFLAVKRRDVAAAWLPGVLDHAARLIHDNATIGRQVLVSSSAYDDIAKAYPARFRMRPDPRAPAPSLLDLVAGLPPGTRYVLSVLKPSRGLRLDPDRLRRAFESLGAQVALPLIGRDDYFAIAGEVGAPPALVRSSSTPFRQRVVLDGVTVDVRMESWLAFDTIRRMGFGQVVAARRHTLIVERGVSFAAFDDEGHAVRRGYASSLFAPEPRWAIVNP